MRVKIFPSTISGKVTAPPSKSASHRLLLGAALSVGETYIENISLCEDTLATIDCLTALGIECHIENSGVRIIGKSTKELNKSAALYCRESGSTLRFIIPLLWLIGGEYTLTGAPSLMARPMTPYLELAEELGLGFTQNGEVIKVWGKLYGGELSVRGDVSSQFITGLLFALPSLPESSYIKLTTPLQSLPYVKLTLQILKEFNIYAELTEGGIHIPAGQAFKAGRHVCEGDYSGTAFLAAMNECGANIEICGLKTDTAQADMAYLRYFPMLNSGTPTIDVGNCPDLAPVLFALAGAKNGATFLGTKRLKIKESDRAQCMKEELKKLGIEVTVLDNECRVYGKLTPPCEPLYAHNDHRIVMALSVLLLTVGGEIIGAEAISKSYPSFFSDLKKLGAKILEYDT